MDPDLPNKRARNLIATYDLTDAEVRQIIAIAQLQLATFDPGYRANVSQLSADLDRSRPTLYHWADRALHATVSTLRTIRTGRPPKHLRGRHRARSGPVPAPARDRAMHDDG
jgi:hypothetical protein